MHHRCRRHEFAAAGRGNYAVYDLDCTGDPVPVELCKSGRDDCILWSMPVQDISSSVTGSSVFDFEGDCKAEVVYNDECYLYILSGEDGSELLKMENSSRTAAEYPLIVDVDADGNSEFIVPANDDRQNVQGEGVFNAPDLSVPGLSVNTSSCPSAVAIQAQIANTGSLGVIAGVPVGF